MKQVVEDHLDELRKRLIFLALTFSGFFLVGLLLSPKIIDYLQAGRTLILIKPMEIIYAYLDVAVFFALFCTIPFLLYEFFSFVKPGLKKAEKRLVIFSAVLGVFLFVLGALFAYFILIQFMLWFFTFVAEATGVLTMWSLENYLMFIFFTIAMLGIAFELPVVILALKKLGIISENTVRNKRKYFLIGAFAVAALISPPDPITQVLIAVPMVLLYEISLLLIKKF